MVYALQSMFLVVYLTEAMHVSNWVLGTITIGILVIRILDSFNDLLIGAIVDNTRTRWGPYKPWILAGVLVSAAMTVVLFHDFGLSDAAFVVAFCFTYVLWTISFSFNDIPYWSLVPALSLDQKERERMSSLAKVFATIGLFTVVVGVIPITNALGGGVPAWTTFAAAIGVLMVLGQLVTLFGVRQERLFVPREHLRPREIFAAVLRNDQLLWTAFAMALFQTGYVTTTSFGVYFFKYAYGDETMYSPFAAVLGLGMILGFVLFPIARRRFTRKQLYTGSMATIVAAYGLFFFSPMNIVLLCLCGLMLFIADSFIVILMIGFITDCVEYGQWKLGHRNNAVTFAVQPFINQVGGALAQAILGVTLILTGINGARTPADVTPAGLWGMKVMMMVFPAVLIVASYLIYRKMFVIDEAMHARIVADLKERGELTDA
nr:MFS transporter [Propionibacterium sp.]